MDILLLDSGQWVLGDELAATPWHILIYRQSREPRNELHLWLPRESDRRSPDLAFRRFWVDDGVRWCVESRRDPALPQTSGRSGRGSLRLRFTAGTGAELWVEHQGPRGLADLSEEELRRLRDRATPSSFSRS